jgi:hypothetical protein
VGEGAGEFKMGGKKEIKEEGTDRKEGGRQRRKWI